MGDYLIIPFEVKQCGKCGAYNLMGEDRCIECGEKMEVEE